MIFLIYFLTLNTILNLQSFNDKRILVIVAQEKTENVKNQIQRFKAQEQKVENRKLAVFTKINGEFMPIMNTDKSSLEFVKKHARKFEEKSQIQNYLIGLDQGIKKIYNGLVEPSTIFNLIDSMPMRRAEMRRKGE